MKTSASMNFSAVLVLIFLSTSGCEDDSSPDALQSQLNSIQFELVALDEQGTENTIFEVDTDLSLALKITNGSNEDFLWDWGNDCILMDLEDFYTIHRVDNTEGGDNQTVTVGKPYPPFAGCHNINLPAKRYAPGTTVFLAIPWSTNSANSPLGAGKYFSAFQHNLRIDNSHSIALDLRVDFEIQ